MAIATAAPSIARVEAALRLSWSAATSADPSGWTPENPAWGQCAVSALVVQDELGGELLRCVAASGSHYFNVLPDGRWLDTTARQFGRGFAPTDPALRSREYVLGFATTRRRYALLRARVDVALGREL